MYVLRGCSGVIANAMRSCVFPPLAKDEQECVSTLTDGFELEESGHSALVGVH